MPATAKVTRFFAPEITKIRFAANLANEKTATRAEITASTLLENIAAISGWTASAQMIDTPDLDSRWTSQIGGRLSAESSSLTFYGDIKSVDVRKILPRGTAGYVIIMDGGDVPTSTMDIFKVEVIQVSKIRSVDNGAFQLTVQFAITAMPAEDVAIPAGA